MTPKTRLTLSVSVTLAMISMAPTAVFAQFPGPPPMGPGGPPPIAAGGLPAFAGPPPWGLAVRPMPASAVRLLGWAPARFLAAISGALAASVPAVVADPRLHARFGSLRIGQLQPLRKLRPRLRRVAIRLPRSLCRRSLRGWSLYWLCQWPLGLRVLFR